MESKDASGRWVPVHLMTKAPCSTGSQWREINIEVTWSRLLAPTEFGRCILNMLPAFQWFFRQANEKTIVLINTWGNIDMYDTFCLFYHKETFNLADLKQHYNFYHFHWNALKIGAWPRQDQWVILQFLSNFSVALRGMHWKSVHDVGGINGWYYSFFQISQSFYQISL